MRSPADTIATIQALKPMSQNTLDFIDSGRAITGAELLETLAGSLADGLNLALHCADKASIAQARKLALDLIMSDDSVKFEDKDLDKVKKYIAVDLCVPLLEAIQTFSELKSTISGAGKPSDKLVFEANEIYKDNSHLYVHKLPGEDEFTELFNEFNEHAAPYFSVLPLVKQLSTEIALEALLNGDHTKLAVWMPTEIRMNVSVGLTSEARENEALITDYIIRNNKEIPDSVGALSNIGSTLKGLSTSRSIDVVSSIIEHVDGFQTEDFSKSGLKFHFAMLKAFALGDEQHRAKALSVADQFQAKFFTAPEFKLATDDLFQEGGAMHGAMHAVPKILGITKDSDIPANVAYEVMSRVNRINPYFDKSSDPSMLMTLVMDKEILAKPLAYYLSLDPRNEKLVRAAITNTWQQELMDTVSPGASEQKRRRAPEDDSGLSM